MISICVFVVCVESHVDLLPAGGCVPLYGRRRVPLGADRAFDRGRGGGGRRMTRLGRASLFFFLLLLLLRGKVHLQHRRGILRRARKSDILLLLLLLLLLLFLRLVSSSPLASRRVELHHVPVEVPTAQRALDRRLLLLLELLLVEAAAPRAARGRVGRGGDAGGGRPRSRSRGPLKKRKGTCYMYIIYFLVFLGARHSACTIPLMVPSRGEVTLDTSLRPGGGAWGRWAPNLVCPERGSNPGPPACEAGAISFTPSPRGYVL